MEDESSGNEFNKFSINELKLEFGRLKQNMMDLLKGLSEDIHKKLDNLARREDGALDIGGAVDELLKTSGISDEDHSILENYTQLRVEARKYKKALKDREQPYRDATVARAQADTEARREEEVARSQKEFKFDRLRSILRKVGLVDTPTLVGIPAEEQVRVAVFQYITEANKILKDVIFGIAQGVDVEELKTNARRMVQLDDEVIRSQVQKYDPDGFRDIDELWQQIPK